VFAILQKQHAHAMCVLTDKQLWILFGIAVVNNSQRHISF